MELAKVDQEAEWLADLFQQCVDYIDALIMQAMKENPTSRSLQYWRKRAALVHRELAFIHSELVKRTPDVVQSAYHFGHAIAHVSKADGYDADAQASNFGTAINKRAIALLAAGMNKRLDGSLVTVGRRVDDAFRQAGMRAAAYHAVAGTSVAMAAQQMEAQLKRDAITGFVDKRGRQWSLGAYTNMVIRTTTREAVTQGTYQGLIQTGHNIYQISHHDHACELCLRYDGKTFAMPEAPDAIKARYPVAPGGLLCPYHPNFVCEGESVRLLGRVRGASRAYYSGPTLVVETSSGIRMRIGPNHPVLTQRGWIPAHELCNFDQVLRHINGGFKRATSTASTVAAEDGDKLITLVDHVFDTLSALGRNSWIVPSASDFYGHGRYMKGEVEIVDVNNFLPRIAHAKAIEEIRKGVFVFAGPEEIGLARERTGTTCLKGVHRVSSSIPRSFHGRWADDCASFAQALSESSEINPLLPSELAESFSGVVTTDEIINVTEEYWCGHVYDFETSSRAYSVNGIITHNCKHVIAPAKQSFDEIEAELLSKYTGAKIPVFAMSGGMGHA